MKLIAVLIFVFIAGANASSKAQYITLSVKNAHIKEVFSKIKEQTNYRFLYSEESLQKLESQTLEFKNAGIEEVLNNILGKADLKYRIRSGTITIIQGESQPVKIKQPNIEVRGQVTDSLGVLYGVSVTVKDQPAIGTSTDVNGRYILEVPSNSVLVFRYVGYITQEISIGDREVIDIQLQSDQTGLDEVVVVGFGQQKKESLVSSVATIKGTQLRMPNRSLSNNLAGQIPGLIAVQRSGEPGFDNSEFWIRGVSSFAGGTSPLVLVDGVPRNMNDIEPDEIETFTLLKDASATAVYGAEGANGVILITSKRGIVQKTVISYRGEYSLLTPTRVPQFANSVDYMSSYNEALINDGGEAFFSDELISKYASGEDPDLYPSSNWWDILMKDNTNNMRHSLNFRGGGEKMRFFVSGAYFGESGYYKVNNDYNNNAGLKRYNLRSNVDINVTNSTLLRVDLSGQYLQTNSPGPTTVSIFEYFSRIPPHLFPAVYSDGSLADHPSPTGNKVNPYNKLVESGYRKEWRSGIQSRVDLEQNLDFITTGLKIRGAVSYDSNSDYWMSRLKEPDTYFAEGRDENGELIFRKVRNEKPFAEPVEASTGNKNIYMEGALDYNHVFEKHAISGLLLTYQKERQLHSDALAYRKQAYIGRSTYTFDNRYSLEASFGFTGSENFADGYRFGFFPAIGLAWNITNEPYFPEDLRSAISSLKLRMSIGRTGNDNTGGARFLYRPTFNNATGYSLGIGSTGPLNSVVGGGLVEGRFAAPALSWEIETKRNYGVDVSFWNGRIDIQMDYFNNYRTDILLQRRTVPGAAGLKLSPYQNFGEVSNKGFDGSLNFRHQVGEVRLSTRGNITYARNKIMEYDEIPQPHSWMNRTGTRLNSLTGYQTMGLFTKDDFHISTNDQGKSVYTLKEGIANTPVLANPMPGDIRYVDQNGDGVIDDYDYITDIANPTIPELIYGFGLNVEWKAVYFNLFFQGAGNVSLNLNNQANAFMPFQWGVDESNVRQEIIDSRWTTDNPSQDVFFPRLRISETLSNARFSEWWFRDASFLRLKNIEVGYNFKSNILSKTNLKNGRLYLMGQNVALWDKVKVHDPEMGTSAGGTKYPLPSIWTLGLELNF